MKWRSERAERWWRRLAPVGKPVLVLMVASLALLWAALTWVPLPERLSPPVSTVVKYDDGRPAHVFVAADGRWRIAADHREVDPDYLRALLALEDQRFFEHSGVDAKAVMRAMWTNATRGRVVSGASTLTMQVVRMAEPRPRTISSKIVEAFRAYQIERHFSKEEILDIYLTLLPFGRNYEGVETAALVYFGHDASALSPAEISTLLAVPQAPAVRYPTMANEARLRGARDRIASRLLEQDALPRGMRSDRITREEALEAIRSQPVPVQIRALPRGVPHLATQLRQEFPGERALQSEIDPSLQRVVESMVAHHERTIRQAGADNIAVVVMDHRTGALKALVGSFDFFEDAPAVQIPAYDVRRSTGSLIKPFLLARAIDRGLAAPSHRVVDAPVNFGGYRPVNFDGNYDGLVRLGDALSRSLNIPFVNLLESVGTDDFLRTLQRLGLSLEDETARRHGLSLAVGGVDATPVEVAVLFSALARRGDPLVGRRLKGAEEAVPNRPGPLTAESAWLVRGVMQERERPGFANRGRLRGGRSPYAWKTGTSMGFRDAWTAGSGPRYVVVVWTGNLDYRSGRYLVGEAVAAPLFFDIIEAIDPARGRALETAPMGLESVEVCSFSGHLPTAACEHTETVEMPLASVATRACPYHVQVDVDVETGEAVNRACQGDRKVETRSYLNLPKTTESYFSLNSQQGRRVPPLAPECRGPRRGTGPRVVAPSQDVEIALIPGLPEDAQMIPLEAIVEGEEVSFFVNGRFFGAARSGERLWWRPERGRHEVVAMDRAGRAQSRTLVVR